MRLKNRRRRALRVRSKIKLRTDSRLRLSIFRSNKHLYAQLIDDVQGKTLVHVSTLLPEVRAVMSGKLSKKAGRVIGELFVKNCIGISREMIFDRGCYPYMGIISEFVDTVRALGVRI